MKTKFFLFVAVVALVFVGCNGNNPESKELIGTWSEQYHEKEMIQSLTFDKDGNLLHLLMPDTTYTNIPQGGFSTSLRYSIVETNKLLISRNMNDSHYDDIMPFEYKSDYSISAGILTIDSFSYDGIRFYKPVILYKQ